jgi:hypothetical protein
MSSDKKSPAVPLSLEYQEANRLHLAILDMQDARKYLHAHEVLRAAGGAAPDVDETLYEALIIAAIVAYCRPFSWNRGDGHALPKLSIEKFRWGLSSNPVLSDLHELVCYKRGKFVAHADWQERSTEIVGMTAYSVTRTFSRPDLMEGLKIFEFLALTEAVEDECGYQAAALQHRMYREANP